MLRRLRGGGRAADRYRLLFATDLHGSENCFRKFLGAVTVHRVDALVLGGDLTGKALRPLVECKDGLRAGLNGSGPLIVNEEAAVVFEKRTAASGAYSVRLTAEEASALDADRVDEIVHVKAVERARAWARLAGERLADTGVKCFVTGGNDDTPDVLAAFDDANPSVVFCDQRVVALDGGPTMASVGFSNLTPWDTPREISEDALGAMIDSVVEELGDPGSSIFCFHVPPIASGLDRCPQLDTSTDPPTVVRIGGEVVFGDAGSSAVRQSLARYQPRVALHGHIHESRGAARIGATLALNPGSEYRDGILRAALVTISGTDVRHQFIAG